MTTVRNERRHWPRYQVKPGILLFNESIFAEIINVSKGGVLCAYLVTYGEDCSPMRSISFIDTKRRSCFLAIPCADLNYWEPGADMPMAILRKSRLKFIPMHETFEHDLQSFIETIIADPV